MSISFLGQIHKVLTRPPETAVGLVFGSLHQGKEHTTTMRKNKKFILLGWDAADWKAINPLIEAGKMPNLEKLINEGVMGNLATLDPPYSPMLWTSIASGKRPYNHGVLGFHEPCEQDPGVRPVMSTTRHCKAIWNILTQKDYKTHVVGWWPSHPAEPINGVAISDFFQKPEGKLYEPWPLAPGSVYPPEDEAHFADLRVHPEELTGNHLLPFIPKADKINQIANQRLYAVARETAMAASLHNAFTNILRTREWDFAALYLATIDHYSHGFMKYHPPKRPHITQPDFDLYHNVVAEGYIFHDMMLGRILDFVNEDTTIMLVSDHGFQPDHLRPRGIPKEPAGPAYEHSPYGIFVMKGPGIKKDEIIYGANLLDVTPTILNVLDLPVGEDMDGKVLGQIFESPKEIETITSWEVVEGECGMHPKEMADNEDMAAMALQQLVDLGYIEKPGKDPEENRKKARDECQFNLAKAYIDGGLTEKSIPILEKLYRENSEVSRYAFLLAVSYQTMNELKKCRAVIEDMRDKEMFSDTTLDVMEGSLLLGEGQPIKAIKLFKKAEKALDDPQTRMHLQIARGYMMLQRWEDAERALLRELVVDNDNAQAHAMLGTVYLRDMYYNKAVQFFLQAIGLEYEMPQVHFELGMALYSLGEYEKAVEAMEVCLVMAPFANNVRQKIIEIYQTHLDQNEKAQHHIEQFDDSILGTVTIVSGLPRSGTSMMMQMLEKGGLEAFTDKERAADENNPRGYYEHEAVKNLQRNNEFVKQAVNKSLKVIANLLMSLPLRFRYKIIFMERDLNEIWASQQKMLQRMGKNTREDIYPTVVIEQNQRTLEKVKQWASRHANVEIMYVQHREVIENPFEQALRINEFLGYTLLPELMVQAVDDKLYREKDIRKQLNINRSPLGVSKIIEQHAADKIYCEIGIGEGHLLNAVQNTKKTFGIEQTKYGVTRCKELYPHIEVIHSDFWDLSPRPKFDVCYMWIVYPSAEKIVNRILEENENCTVIIGLNHFFHMEEASKKQIQYISAYPPIANAADWNDNIKNHLAALKEKAFDYDIQQVPTETGELFSVAVVKKAEQTKIRELEKNLAEAL